MKCFRIKKGTEWTEDKIYEAMEFVQNNLESAKLNGGYWAKSHKIIIESL